MELHKINVTGHADNIYSPVHNPRGFLFVISIFRILALALALASGLAPQATLAEIRVGQKPVGARALHQREPTHEIPSPQIPLPPWDKERRRRARTCRASTRSKNSGRAIVLHVLVQSISVRHDNNGAKQIHFACEGE